MSALIDQIRHWPTGPGVYIMRDAKGVVLYVGKAKNLHDRIANYFNKSQDTRYQVAFLMRRVTQLEFIVAATEKEALLLEYTLIQKYKPKYNIFWKDDKSFVRIRMNLQHDFPGIYTTRQVSKDGARYFGPYTSSKACRDTVDTIIKQCRLRSCTDREFANRSRPCIQYQIGRCTAPCVGYVSAEAYAQQVQQAVLLLEGRASEVKTQLSVAMTQAAADMCYEEAAQLRDRIRAIDETLESQQMIRADEVDEDWLGWAAHEGRSVVSLLMVRSGKVQDRIIALDTIDPDEPEAIAEKFLFQYYQPPQLPPPKIYWPFTREASAELLAFLSERRATPVRIISPKQSQHRNRLKLAQANADSVLASSGETAQRMDLRLKALQQALQLPEYPQRIECVDISNWQGEQAVGAVVVFEAGKPAKSEYRHYNIQGPHEPNDYYMMYETLMRRYAKYPVPQLLVVDGGKGQLQVALRVVADLRLSEFPIAAIAKGRGKGPDRIFLPNRKNALALKAGSPVLLLLENIRDAAHHFGVSFVRHKMRKARVKPSSRPRGIIT